MLSTLVTLVAVLSSVVSSLEQDRSYYEAKFFSWMKEYSFRPGSGEVFVHYLSNFIDNDKFIEKQNARVNATYVSGHNQFSHMNREEWAAYVNGGLAGVRRPASSKVHKATDAALPASVNWVTAGAVSPVKDQGQCGSCWSFSTTGALEGAGFVTFGVLNSLSEQNLVDCDIHANGGSDLGCHGGLYDSAFTWTTNNGGLCSEAAYPYTSGVTKQKGSCTQNTCSKVPHSAAKTYTDVEKNSDSALMSAIAQQPVSIAIEADCQAFQTYKSGVFTDSCGTNLDHAVLAVGYGTQQGQDYYYVKNSWGTSWGAQGYIYLARGPSQGTEGNCGILAGPPAYPTV